MQNIEDSRNDLIKKYEEAKSDKDKSDLSTYSATASAIIRSCKVELDYNKVQDNKRTIKFLEPKN